MIRRVSRQRSQQIFMGTREVVIRKRWKHVMQRVILNRKRKKQPSNWIATGVVARVDNVFGHRQVIPVAFEMMVGELPKLVQDHDRCPK